MKQILCFGDSNTWGYNPRTGERFPWGVRWTSILQEKLIDRNIRIVEEGLCGRTTIFEDPDRAGRKGVERFPTLLETHSNPDGIVIMLGTNDCKSAFHASVEEVRDGIVQLLEQVRRGTSNSKVLLVSPIYLGENVWKEGYDADFSKESVLLSHQLEDVYEQIAEEYHIHYLRASAYANSSVEDQEHMDERGHQALATAIENKIYEMSI